MEAAHLVREARRRSGLTQAALAARLDTTQSVVARWEAGRTSPSADTLTRIARACGFDLDLRLWPHDDNWSIVQENRRLTPEARLEKLQAAVDFIQDGRAAMAAARA